MERRLAAILAADVVGYTRLMGADEAGTLGRMTRLRQDLLEPLIAAHRGRVVKLMGDGLLIEFASVVDAVTCAIAWQTRVAEDQDALRFRIGVNLGDLIVEGDDLHGDGVNVAARLEAMAEPGGLCLSDDAYRQVRGKIEADFEDLGEQSLKNVARPLRVYRLAGSGDDAPPEALPAALPLPEKPSVAVLPFTNMSGGAEQEAFADGITEDIITALAKIPRLFVIARNSTFAYKGQAVDAQRVGREQGVRYLLEGSVRRSGDRFRITAQLIDATNGHHIWAQRYDRQMVDIFDLQDEITREIASALQVELTEGEQARLRASGTKSLEAWELMLPTPDMLYAHRREDQHAALALVRKAVAIDPDYAAAWNMLGWLQFEDAFNAWTDKPDEAIAAALEAAERSHGIDPTHPETFALLAFVHLELRDFDKVDGFTAQAVQLAPNNAFVMGIATNVALFFNRPEEGIGYMKRAMRLSPIHPAWYSGDLGWCNFLMGRLEQTIALSRTALAKDPNYIYAFMTLAMACAESGQETEARAAAAEIRRIHPTYTRRAFAQTQPFHDPEVTARHLAALEKAGLPA